MRLAALIAIGAALVVAQLPIALWPTYAQDVQVEAPQFSVGDWHLVRSDDGDTLLTVTSVDADGVRVTDDPGDGHPSITYYDTQLNLVKSEYEAWTNYFEPSTMRYSFPLFVGKSWEGEIAVRSEGVDGYADIALRRSYSCEVQCIEAANVPAGRFETFKTVCETQDSDDSVLNRRSYWYSPTAGMSVRHLTEKFQPNTGWLTDFEQVLVGFSRASAVEFNVLPDGVESTCDLTISMKKWAP